VARALSPEQKLRNRVRDLERIVSEWPLVLLEREVWEYVESLAAIHHLAHSNVRRPDDLGGHVNGNGPSSRAPSYDAEAMAQLKVELAHLRQRATVLRDTANDCDSGKAKK